MTSLINIREPEQAIKLSSGTHNIRVIGGWGIELGDFSINLRHVSKEVTIKVYDVLLKSQSFALKKRAKKIFSIDIPEDGEYYIDFDNQSDLKVWRDPFILTKTFLKPMPNEQIRIVID